MLPRICACIGKDVVIKLGTIWIEIKQFYKNAYENVVCKMWAALL